MQFRNDGAGADNIIRNHFTAYLKLRFERRKRDILRKRARLTQHEVSVDYESCFADRIDSENAMLGAGRDPMTWDNELLVSAFQSLTEREQTILIAHVLDEATFEELGDVLGLSYKGASTAYYRVINKLRKYMTEGADKKRQ